MMLYFSCVFARVLETCVDQPSQNQAKLKDFRCDKVNIAWCSMGYGKLFTLEETPSKKLHHSVDASWCNFFLGE